MSVIVVPTSVFHHEEVRSRGQEAFASLIKQHGGAGIEIRRELFSDGDFRLKELNAIIKKHRLFPIYSAPIEMWDGNGQFNHTLIEEVISEAETVGAKIMKVSLGNYQAGKSDLAALKQFTARHEEMQLTIENDQTAYGGCLQTIRIFFENAVKMGIPVKMTFDIGNWIITGENPIEAAKQLADYVVYVHLKKMEQQNGKWRTLPISEKEMEWRNLLNCFPKGVLKAIEFPIARYEETKQYVKLLQDA